MAGQQRRGGGRAPRPAAEPDQTGSRQEGSRWIGTPPTPDEFAKWFGDNVTIHDGLDATDYAPGITLISGKEKVKQINQGGGIIEVERLVHTPYAKIETRVKYWNAWLDLAAQDEVVGVIQPADVKRLDVEGFRNDYLPPGFFRHPVKLNDGKFAHFICCSFRCRLLKADSVEEKFISGRPFVTGTPVREWPTGTKMIPTLAWNKVDENAIMKAETGAVGRALGMASMLVIPGSGVATAEDMLELQAGPSNAEGVEGGGESDAQLPDAEQPGGEQDEVRKRIAELFAKVLEDKPGKVEEIRAWATEKKIDLDDLKEHQLRGVLRKLEAADKAD